jgi:hypothetical protein
VVFERIARPPILPQQESGSVGAGKRLLHLTAAGVGDGGWVDLPEPIIVRAGEAFIAVPAPPEGDGT